MKVSIKRWIAPPTFEGDEKKTRQAELTNMVILGATACLVLLFIGSLFGGETLRVTQLVEALFFAACILLRGALLRGKVTFAGAGMLVAGMVALTASLASLGTVRAPSAMLYLLMIVSAGLLFDWRGVIIAAATSSLAVLGLILAQNMGILPEPDYAMTIVHWATYTSMFGLGGGFILYATRTIQQALARAEEEIAARKRLEVEMRKLTRAIEQSPLSVVIADLEANIEYVNPRFTQVTGYSVEEALGQNPRILKSGKTSTETHAQLWETLTAGNTWHGQFVNRKKDGSIYYESALITPITDQHGKQTHYLALKEDITEQIQVEQALRESEARFHAMFEGHEAVMLLVEPVSGEILDANQSAENFYGYQREVLRGMSVNALNALLPEENPSARLETAAWKKNDFVHSHRLANGEIRMVEVHSSPLGVNGRTILFSIIYDVTERERAEEKLRESEARLRLLSDNLRNAGLYVYAHDAEGKPHFEYLSAGMETLTGVGMADALRDAGSVLGLILPEYLPALAELEAKSKRALSSFEMEIRQRHAVTGEIRWMLLRSAPRRREDGSTVWYGVQMDITARKNAATELERVHARYRALFEQSHDAVFILDLEGRHLEANQRAADMLGYSIEELLALSVREISAQLPQSSNVLKRLKNGERIPPYERLFRKKNGEVIPVEINAEIVRDADGQPLHVQSLVRDISERKRMEIALRQNELHYRIVANNTHDWEFWQSPAGDFLYVSPSCMDITGYPVDEFLRNPDLLTQIIHHEDQTIYAEHNASVVSDRRQGECEFRIIAANKNLRWISHVCQPVFDDTGKYLGMRGSNRDVTERKRMEIALENTNTQLRLSVKEVLRLQEDLRQQALRDELTGLYNRRYMQDVFAREFSRATRESRSLSLIMVDMDGLKMFNDKYGHSVGDRAIQALGACIKGMIRTEDVACRYGGDEFILILPKTAAEDAARRTEEWRRFLAERPITINGEPVVVKFTAGIASFPECGHTVDEVTRKADVALYRAKECGRNCTIIFQNENGE